MAAEFRQSAVRGGVPCRNHFAPPLQNIAMDWVLIGIIALLLGFVFFIYLFIRRTVTGFRQGVEGGGK
jgi:hypothetical protein